MHFMSDIAPITLHTDASDYGVGGYLFQTVDGIDQPIAFVSKSLNKSQLLWSVYLTKREVSNSYVQRLAIDERIQIDKMDDRFAKLS